MRAVETSGARLGVSAGSPQGMKRDVSGCTQDLAQGSKLSVWGPLKGHG